MAQHCLICSAWRKHVISLAVVLVSCLQAGLAFAVTSHSGSLTVSETWQAGDVHLITSTVTVQPGVTLTIEPGAIVKFNPTTMLDVSGVLVAQGTESGKIVFTSYRDDSVGGDTNNNGASVGAPGDWYRINFNDSVSDSLVRVSFVEIRYAGAAGSYAALQITSANIEVSHSTIVDSVHHGIGITTASPVVRDNRIERVAQNGINVNSSGSPVIERNTILNDNYLNSGIAVTTATPTVKDNRVEGFYWGFWNNDARALPVMTGNTLINNVSSARIPASAIPSPSDNNVLVPNRINGLWVLGNTRSTPLTLGVQVADGQTLNTYHFSGTTELSSSAPLTVEAGVVLKFAAGTTTGITANAAVTTNGTLAQPVIFTAETDDAHGGDFNDDQTLTSPYVGYWSGVQLTNSVVNLSHTEMLYTTTGLVFSGSQLTMSGGTLAFSNGNGLRITSGAATLSQIESYANLQDGLRLEGSAQLTLANSRVFANGGDGIDFSATTDGAISGTELFANVGAAVRNTGNQAIDARGNWWGAPTGPTGNDSGTGDEIVNTGSGSISVSDIFTGVLTDGTEFFYYDAGGNDHYGFGINAPTASGIPSTEWGTAYYQSILHDYANKRVALTYDGLGQAQYDVLALHLSNDAAQTRLRQRAGSEVLAAAYALPQSRLVPTETAVAASAIVDGSLAFSISADQGPRALVSAVYLLKTPSTDVDAPSVSISSPAAGALLPGSQVTVTGAVTDNSGVAGVELGIAFGDGEFTWYTVSSIALGQWSHRWTVAQSGAYQLKARARDQAGNVQETSNRVPVLFVLKVAFSKVGT